MRVVGEQHQVKDESYRYWSCTHAPGPIRYSPSGSPPDDRLQRGQREDFVRHGHGRDGSAEILRNCLRETETCIIATSFQGT